MRGSADGLRRQHQRRWGVMLSSSPAFTPGAFGEGSRRWFKQRMPAFPMLSLCFAMRIRGCLQAITLPALAALGVLAVAGLASGCGGSGGLPVEVAGDAGQGAGGQGLAANSSFAGAKGGSIGASSGTAGAPRGVVTCTFGGLLVNDESVSSYTESGITVVATAGAWQAWTGYGKPAPFIAFFASAGGSTTGQVKVTAGGSAFSFLSVDLYSSMTTIPYVFTGLMGSTKAFSVSGTVPNTFGDFATVANPSAGDLIDTLIIELNNGMVENPMGLDNVRLSL
jgi:hypothetical protein